MANTYHKIYLQAVFAVKYRQALIQPEWKKDLFAVIGNLINETGCQTIGVNGVEDHVHCLFTLKPVVSISDVMQIAKGKSSKFVNEIPTSCSTPGTNDHWGFHVTNKNSSR